MVCGLGVWTLLQKGVFLRLMTVATYEVPYLFNSIQNHHYNPIRFLFTAFDRRWLDKQTIEERFDFPKKNLSICVESNGFVKNTEKDFKGPVFP